METLSFMLGVSAVLITMGIVVMFSMYKKIKTLLINISSMEETQRETYRYIDRIKDELYSRIYEEKQVVQNIESLLRKDIDEYSKTLISTLDSRLDKLENKLKSKSSKKLINE